MKDFIVRHYVDQQRTGVCEKKIMQKQVVRRLQTNNVICQGQARPHNWRRCSAPIQFPEGGAEV